MFRKPMLAAGVLGVLGCVALATGVSATNGNPLNTSSQNATTLAVIGDNPYGPAKIAAFPGFIDFINSDPRVDLVAHVGDIKSGSTICADEYLAWVRDEFERLKDPVVYTPGDNEWTDCHRPNNGGYDPLERLQALRSTFFPSAGETLGVREKRVLTQAADPVHGAYIENVMWMESKVVFATLNLQGSNNGTAPWTGNSEMTTEQAAEVAAREAANLAWIAQAFETAEANGAKGVALIFQADMWDGASASDIDGFTNVVNAIGEASVDFGEPVLLLAGDSHVFIQDQPYDGSFQALYPDAPIALNVTRVIVEGSADPADRMQYVRLTVNPKSAELFTIERVDYHRNS